MSRIYNLLKEIQDQKKTEGTSPSTGNASADILPSFSRSARKPIPKKKQFHPNALFFIIVAFCLLLFDMLEYQAVHRKPKE